MYTCLAVRSRMLLLNYTTDVKSLVFNSKHFLMKLFKSAYTDIIIDCLLHFKFSLPSESIQERKEKFVSKFAHCNNLLHQFGIEFT